MRLQKKQLREKFREMVDDVVETYGWSNDTVDMLLDEGMDAFCEDTGFFVDFNTYTITTEADVADYDFDLDLRVIQVLEVWDPTTGVRLSQFDQSDRPDWVDNNVPIAPVTRPYMWQTDRETGIMTFYPTPSEAHTFQIRVWRYAKKSFGAMAETDYPEIPGTCHLAPAEYAAWKAYKYHDRELANTPKADDHQSAYKQYVARGKKLFQHTRGTPPHLAPSLLYAFR